MTPGTAGTPARHVPAASADVLRIAHVELECDVLGPRTRAVVYVQGCHLRCRGCIAEAWLDPCGGRDVAVGELSDRLVRAGVTANTIRPGGAALAA